MQAHCSSIYAIWFLASIMANSQEYLDATTEVLRDLSDIGELVEDIGLTLTTADRVLALPGDLETLLRDRADVIDLPNSVVRVLGALPYGIGTAIRQLDRVAEQVSGTVERQADILAQLDRAWQPAQNAVTVLSEAASATSVALTGLRTGAGIRQDEARALVQSLGQGALPAETELATRIDSYVMGADRWFAVRDGLLSPMRTALAEVDQALDALEALVPDPSFVGARMDEALVVFRNASNTANRILNALDIDIDLPWPFPDTNLIDVIEGITGAFAAISGFVEDLVFGILRRLGLDIDRVFDPVEDAMLQALQPVFGAISSLQSASARLLETITDGLEILRENRADAMAELRDAVDFGALFANTQFGDEAPGLIDFADRLTGGDDEDALYGLRGNDQLAGGAGGDFLFGGAGRDSLTGQGGDDELYGGAANDALYGGAQQDRLFGQTGNDTLWGGTGNDTVVGGDGTDHAGFAVLSTAARLVRDGQRVVVMSSEGVDFLEGVEFLRFDDRVISVASLPQGTGPMPGPGNDYLLGGPGRDFLDGLSGNDTLIGRDGADTLRGSAGNDLLQGGAGADHISDLDGDTTVYAGAGDDLVQTGAGADELWGGTDGDRLFAGAGADTVGGGAGNDQIGLGADNDQGWAGAGADTVFGADGDDTIAGAAGRDDLWAGAGDDLIYSGSGNDRAAGAAGDDTLWGGSENDQLFGGEGEDELRGGSGRDTLFGGTGNDLLIGGLDSDVFVFTPGADTVSDFESIATGEVIDLRYVAAITDFDDLTRNHLSETGAGVVITAGADSLTLAGIRAAALTEADFLF